MGIYIKGMEMPKHCMDCPFMVSRDGDDCILQSAEANENFESWEQMKAGCPLVPVPTHGRLGDLDKLIDKVIAKYLEHERKGELVFAAAEVKQDIVDLISDAPVIIPAEEDEA